jgi:glycosyltransferase involved in cell wall biosynthesis
VAVFIPARARSTWEIVARRLREALRPLVPGVVWIDHLPGTTVAGRLARVLARLARERVDAAHVHFHGIDHWGAGVALRSLGVPYGLTFHHWGGLKSLPAPRRWAACAYLRWMLRGARFVTAVSEPALKGLLDDFPSIAPKSSVVPNGLRPPSDLASRPGRAVRGKTAKPHYILSVGSSHPLKGWDVLALAFREAAERDPALRLVLCGPADDSLRRLLKVLRLRDRVEATGWLDPAELAARIDGCLFYVSPAREEAFGLALGEAMLAGKAVVATRTAGGKTQVRHGRDGLLVPVGDPAALARAMRSLLERPALRRRLGAAARKSAARWHWDHAARRYAELYRRCARGRAA